MQYIWLIPLLPGLGAAINGLVGIRSFSRQTVGRSWRVATMVGALGAVAPARSGSCSACRRTRAPTRSRSATGFRRSRSRRTHGIGPFGDALGLPARSAVRDDAARRHRHRHADPRLFDRLHADEPRGGFARFFCYLNLFCFFMLVLVLGSNFLVMFVGWEGVGLCSYLLIGYWYEKKSAGDAGKKAFITNRVGDWAFVLGVFLIFYTFGTLDFRAVAGRGRGDAGRGGELGRAVGHLPAALHRRDRQERPDSAVCLAAGRDGRSDAGVRAHPRGDDGHRRRLHARPQRGALLARADGAADRGDRRRADRADGGLDRPGAERHQARARVFDGLAARATCSRRWASGGVRGRRVPPDDARLLQGAALPRQRLGDPRDGRRAGHAADGRAQEVHAGHLRDDDDRHARDRRDPAALRLLQQGRDPLPRVPERTR